MSLTRHAQFVDLAAGYQELRDDIDAAIRRVCESSAFVGGPDVEAFEREWAGYTGAPHAIGVANGTDAIELVLRALDLPAGSAVLVPANTFVATAEGVVAAGLEPRFVDVEADSGLIDLGHCRQLLDERVEAIIPVHLYGRLVDMAAVATFADVHGLVVVEDAAQAHGARRHGTHGGSTGVAGTFSFYPGKNLGAFGDAGAIITADGGLAERVRLLRDHGRAGTGDHSVVGRNSRLDTLQAAVLRAKLPHLDAWNERRRRVADTYRTVLPPDLLDWPGCDSHESESHHLFPVLVDDRDEIADALRRRGVPTAVHYRRVLPATTAFGATVGQHPNAERRADRQISLPIHPHLAEPDAMRVAELVTELVRARA